jgi:hypothetical protein
VQAITQDICISMNRSLTKELEFKVRFQKQRTPSTVGARNCILVEPLDVGEVTIEKIWNSCQWQPNMLSTSMNFFRIFGWCFNIKVTNKLIMRWVKICALSKIQQLQTQTCLIRNQSSINRKLIQNATFDTQDVVIYRS